MFRRSFTVSFSLIVGLLAFSQFTQAQSQLAQVQAPKIEAPINPNLKDVKPNLPGGGTAAASKIQITNIAISSQAECPVTSENDCVTVKWTLQNPPTIFTGLSYEASGKIVLDGTHTVNATANPINSGNATSAVVKAFHVTGNKITGATVTVKLFGQVGTTKSLITEATQTATF
ncbi:MAG: hypothetical protein FJ147_24450 [Deltaproteobacteria bacterium]|nr:hypothetical protein [Deltaproteobacteria bacterium]